jgi:hypothetical protein
MRSIESVEILRCLPRNEDELGAWLGIEPPLKGSNKPIIK